MDGRVLRFVSRAEAPALLRFLASPSGQTLIETRRLVGSRVLEPGEMEATLADPRVANLLGGQETGAILEHERVPFRSFPYEWAPEMLHAAGGLTLELARLSLPEGYGLKDATPYNVLFDGPRPVFVDVASFEERQPGDPLWTAYGQFVRTFLLPLLASRHFGIPLGPLFLGRRDGLESADVLPLCGRAQRLLPPFLSLVTLPAWLDKRAAKQEIYTRKLLPDPEQARFVLNSLLRGAQRDLRRVGPVARKSHWSGYMDTNPGYTADDFQAKDEFVARALADHQPRSLLDVGCNDGHFSALAARAGARVVGIDSDPVVVGQVWRRASADGLNVLPLVVDLARPSPATGWNNAENPSFLERARGAFDAVLMLAVLHHLLVTERIPLEWILGMASELTTGLLVIEYVSPEDPMFRTLARGRDALHAGLTREGFEEACRRRFSLLRAEPICGGRRCLYALRRLEGAACA